MKKRLFVNDTQRFRFVAGRMFAPGTSDMIDERDHPDFKGQKPGQTQRPRKKRSDPVLEILDDSVENIIPKLADLSDEDFDRLVQGEKDGKTRKSLQKAFDEEFLRRAEARAIADNGGDGGDNGEGSGSSE